MRILGTSCLVLLFAGYAFGQDLPQWQVTAMYDRVQVFHGEQVFIDAGDTLRVVRDGLVYSVPIESLLNIRYSFLGKTNWWAGFKVGGLLGFITAFLPVAVTPGFLSGPVMGLAVGAFIGAPLGAGIGALVGLATRKTETVETDLSGLNKAEKLEGIQKMIVFWKAGLVGKQALK
ncbi:MAG: hypothetical protein IH971_11030 [Candidatus Marinimicrobia bacterium]|nr:hypothetical protein [Candidatus Neomarinimicrobiota bacterium]